MGLSDWIRTTSANIRSDGPSFAAKHAAQELYLGAVRGCAPLFDDGKIFWSDEWDILVLLDACRPDLMREACSTGDHPWLPSAEDLQTVRSPASSSHGWMDAHFDTDRSLSKTGYVTSNLFVHDFDVEQFAAFSEVEANLELADGVRFIEPRAVTDRAIDVWRRRDELGVEQLVVHYMQPHTPFRSHPEWFEEVKTDTGWGLGFVELRDGKIDRREFWTAYLDNLEWVLDDVDLLLENVDANVAVSADHGNGLGEWGIYGHPNGIPLSVVREVPWVNVSGRDERTHVPDVPDNYLHGEAALDESAIGDQLEALGYAD
ncbi:LTA synthase family protein [Halobaculum rubrum]|uniref:LTA synthase family protein n=1 Tax=Halobaculum rubrum TaxID=2872158 RepID=UPI001CA3CE15|nr:LTA synthase family protein [Halobaculum rubrum]QZX99907.1 LTA synthase family protein [Halobaculum rubrum]